MELIEVKFLSYKDILQFWEMMVLLFYTLDEDGTPWYNPNPSESSRNRIVWQGYQASDGQLIQYHADKTITRTGDFFRQSIS